jgi:hypothetical protein
LARRALTPIEQARIDQLAARADVQLDHVLDFFNAYGHDELVAVARGCIRQGLDEVIDGRRMRRHSYEQLSSPEKAFCGIRVESALVRKLELPPGAKLDVEISGVEADIKASNRRGWMIGPGQIGEILLLVYYSEPKQEVSVGVIRAHGELLNPSKNRDAKRTLNAYAKKYIVWLADGEHLPVSILSSLTQPQMLHILSGPNRAARLTRFLRLIPPYVPFPREVVETIVGGTDPLRGIRRDAARSPTGQHPLGQVRVLSYQRNKIVEALGWPRLALDEFMMVPAADVHRKGFTI